MGQLPELEGVGAKEIPLLLLTTRTIPKLKSGRERERQLLKISNKRRISTIGIQNMGQLPELEGVGAKEIPLLLLTTQKFSKLELGRERGKRKRVA